MGDETAAERLQALILQTMVAIAGADDRLVESKTETICRLYQQLTGEEIAPVEVARAMEASATSSERLTDLLKRRRAELDMKARETLLRAAYLVLMSDKRVTSRERKKLHDYAYALEIPEIHLSAILEDPSSLS